MSGVVRQGDKDSGGGAVTKGVDSVLVNGRPISVDGSPVSGHRPWMEHNNPKTSGGLQSVIANGIPINIIGNPDTCGHNRSEGSGDVVAG